MLLARSLQDQPDGDTGRERCDHRETEPEHERAIGSRNERHKGEREQHEAPVRAPGRERAAEEDVADRDPGQGARAARRDHERADRGGEPRPPAPYSARLRAKRPPVSTEATPALATV